MKTQSYETTQADRTTTAKQRNAALSKERNNKDMVPEVIEVDTEDDVSMEVDKNGTMPATDHNADLKRLPPIEIPSGGLWSLASAAASAAQMSGVRSSLDSVQSKDSAITLIGTPSTGTVLMAPSGEKGAEAQ